MFWQMDKQFTLIFFLICSASCLEKYLRFTENKEVTDRKFVYELDQKNVIIDAAFNGQILIKYIQYMTDFIFPNLIFHCQVKSLDPQHKILNAFLCKKDILSSKEDCHLVNFDIKTVKFVDMMTFDINFDPSNGFTSSLIMDISVVKYRVKPFDGFYYCKLRNSVGALTSNYIEIQDFEFYKKKMSTIMTPLSKSYVPIQIDDITTFPTYLHCGKPVGDISQTLPKWFNDNVVSPFVWNFCPGVKYGIECYATLVDSRSRSTKTIGDYLDYYQYPNGTVVILGMKGTDYVKSSLLCSYTSFPLRAYAFYLTKNESGWQTINIDNRNQFNKPIQALSPINNDVTVREGTYDTSRFKLRASYIVTPDHAKKTIQWEREGMFIGTLEQNPYELIFPKEITKEFTGKYFLKISQSDLQDEIKFNFNVKVIGVPSLKKNQGLPDIVYRMVNQIVNLTVEFEGNILRRSIEINGKKIDFSSDETKTDSLRQLKLEFPFLKDINVSSYFGDNSSPGLIIYTASNLYREDDSPQAKTHTVTFVAENDVGISKKSILIRVFESPRFTNFPNENNCTNDCKSTVLHSFKCSFDNAEFLGEGLQVKYYWNLNDFNLNNMNERYIQRAYMNINGDTVVIKPIMSTDADRDEKMAALLKDTSLSCQITILEPPQSGHNPPISRLLYNTDNYPELLPKLRAKINLDFGIIAKGSTSWILPLIISLIVLVVIVILILYFCLRGSGETYNVDQKERAQGYDPEKEIRDNEIFQPYERDHDNTTIQPSRLSFNDDDSVGVGSEDGELDVYDIDPGKFNEEGSFIGQYASDPRKTKQVS